MKKITLLLPLFCFSIIIAQAQISKDEEPFSFTSKEIQTLKNNNTVILSPSKSIKTALMEDEEEKQLGLPPRFGLNMEVNLNMNNSGTWTNLDNGGKIWRLSIKSPSAKSINLLYDEFHLPPKGKLHIYNSSKSHVIGAFTNLNNKGDRKNPGQFATGLVYGDEIILEYYHPPNAEFEAVISIESAVHGYKYIRLFDRFRSRNMQEENGFDGSGDCHVNVNCAEGNDWQDEKKGVAMLLINNGTRLCTGSLINNTKIDGRLLFLTANHCLNQDGLDAEGNTNASNWMFYWNYEAPGCNDPASEPTISSTTGATLLANRNDSDFALFELLESPLDIGYDIFFNGWDRNTTHPAGGVGIHHPSGDVKKIATYSMIPGPAESRNPNTHWGIYWVATENGHSVTEGGSSGSPLFNSNNRIIGQLHGGSWTYNPDCNDPDEDIGEYGKLHVSWDGPTATRRLRDWLDPLNTGALSIDGSKIISISGPDVVCSSNRSFNLNNLPDGLNVNWNTSNNLSISSYTINSIKVKASSSTVRGSGLITATINGNIEIKKEVWVEILPADPSPIQGSTNVVPNAWEYYSVPAQEEASSYTWLIPSGWSFHHTSSTTSNQVLLVTGSSSGYVRVRANNECGVSNYRSKYVTVSGNDCGSPVCYFTYSPNPVEETLTVEMESTTFDLRSNETYQISLNNQYGKVVYEVESNSICHDIDMKNMPKGMYRIVVSHKDKQQIAKILKQ